MKKKLLASLLLVCVLLAGLTLTAHAEARLDYVNDYVGLITQEERDELNEKAARISEQYDCGVYIVVVEDYLDYVGSQGIEYFSEEVFDTYGLGVGDTFDGVMLTLSMDQRDYDIYAHGDFGNLAFTDYGKTLIAERILDDLADNDWAGGLSDFVDSCEDLIRHAREGDITDIWIPDPTPEPQPREPEGLTPFKALLSLLFPGLVSGAAVSGMARQMKTANRQTRAENYIARGGVQLRVRQDQFYNRVVNRQVIRRESTSDRPSGGHFGGTTISGSHGGSHHSGKF